MLPHRFIQEDAYRLLIYQTFFVIFIFKNLYIKFFASYYYFLIQVLIDKASSKKNY